MSNIRKYVELLEKLSSEKFINEGVKIGKKEIVDTLKNSKDFQMGIEYEFLTPNPINRVQDANDFVTKYNIANVDKIEQEHDNMMEIVTTTMPINEGIQHIRNFFKSAKDFGITFPSTAGMHVSISHKNAANKEFNYLKFLVLLSGDYLHSIFPEREYVENVSNELKRLLVDLKPKNVQAVESEIGWLMKRTVVDDDYYDDGDEDEDEDDEDIEPYVSKKYITAKLSDYINHNGRVELRFFGGKNYDTMFNEIRLQILRSIYILGIALDDKIYRKEYLKQLGKLVNVARMKNTVTNNGKDALNKLRTQQYNSVAERKKLERVLARDANYSTIYAIEVLGGRFENGESLIAKDSDLSYKYSLYAVKGRFEKGEDSIAKDSDLSYKYSRYVVKGRFEKGEGSIAEDSMLSFYYAIEILGGRFKKGEKVMSDELWVSDKDKYYELTGIRL